MAPTQGGSRPRLTEWILACYFAYTALLALLLALPLQVRMLAFGASFAALAVLHVMARFPRKSLPVALRNVLPIAGVLLAYRQIGWFARPHAGHALEEAWVRWDRMLLLDWGMQGAIESLGPALPGLLELLYLITYAIGPLGLLVLIACGRTDRVDRFLAFFVTSAVAAYALYPYFPSEPPRTVFPGDLYGNYDTIFRRVNWWILGGAGIHTSVFPSGHVSSSFGAGFGLLFALPERKVYGVGMTLVAVGIAVATVYGRYHYAVDALAGLATSCTVSIACVGWFRLTALERQS